MDDEGYCSAIVEQLIEFDPVKPLFALYENMVEVLPHYRAVLDEARTLGRAVSEKDLDRVADALNGKGH